MAAVALAAALRDRGRLIAGQPGQQRHRLLVAARLDDGDGFELFGVGGVGLEQQDGGARLGEGQPGGLVGFVLQRLVDQRQAWLRRGS